MPDAPERLRTVMDSIFSREVQLSLPLEFEAVYEAAQEAGCSESARCSSIFSYAFLRHGPGDASSGTEDDGGLARTTQWGEMPAFGGLGPGMADSLKTEADRNAL
ncbi:hypothetical protein [Streptomyces sp. BPTC-684]|uniref:hypothetical protein n=1 Tax=Streptomyces sp. BPTC-684 TaxID=3043734 RepID=UPI0024B19F10|nr:hypothetical protein [Streptomyces sp. BPTC-684]WHM40034.1 hypothetical protein QIY60_26380 [Streptomyces sp. BPTC-684]